MANFTRNGYGQVEPNQLSAQKTGQIYASLPLDKEVSTLQNGEFMYYDYANNSVNSGKSANAEAGTVATKGEPMLVFNEIKLYDVAWKESYKDFAMIRVGDNYVTTNKVTPEYGDGSLTTGIAASPAHTEYGYRMDGFAPRLLKTNIGDIYTTNMVQTGVEYKVGDTLTPVLNSTSKTLQLQKSTAGTADNAMLWSVVKVYTMPDGQPGLKLQRVQ